MGSVPVSRLYFNVVFIVCGFYQLKERVFKFTTNNELQNLRKYMFDDDAITISGLFPRFIYAG